jgi:signal transduction histidine kinase
MSGDLDQKKPPSAAWTGHAEPNDRTSSSNEVVQQQSKRAEVLGAMAAGVAHEFNNLLTIVLSSLEQVHRQPLDERGQEQLQRAEWGVRQAGRLARQVLSFMRRESRETEVVDVNAALREFDKMLGHIAGSNVKLVMDLAEQPLSVRLDPGQLELGLLNLVRNAAHAMSGSGQVILRTCGHPASSPGGQPLVEVSVSDTGTGMPREVVQRATDSFFTTKEPGQGTGLGLWMVQRFVRACKGKLEIETAVGRGTTIRLVFPRVE